MNSLTLFFIIPAGVFLVIAGLFYINRSLPRWMALLPVLACYGCAAFILTMGGCHNVAHVALAGVEIDLYDDEGKPRDIVIGGGAENGKPSGIEIPGYPVDALHLRWEQNNLILFPGPGYRRGVLVRSGDRLVPLEPAGLPRLVPIESGDVLRVDPQAGGEVLAQWQLGSGSFDLNAQGKGYRWIGAADKGIGRIEGQGNQVVGLRSQGSTLYVKKGPDFKPDMGVMVNGHRLSFNDVGECNTRFGPEGSTFALVGPDPVVGALRFLESGFQRFTAELDWESVAKARPLAHPFDLKADAVRRVGGALEDDFMIKGLPPGAMHLTVGPEGRMTLSLSDAGKRAMSDHKLRGTYPQTNSEVNKGVRVGLENDPDGGVFILLGKADQPAFAADSAKPAAGDTETESDASEGPPASSGPSNKWRCAWLPNATTHWVLPNREIVLPLVNLNVPLGTRRPWTQQVFPLGGVVAGESSLHSMVVYGPKHDRHMFNGASLLQFEQGVALERNGAVLQPRTPPVGLLTKGARLEFLQVMADEQGETHGVSFGTPFHAAWVWDATRVSLRKRFPEFSVSMRTEVKGSHKQKMPVLRVRFEKPVIRSIPLGEVTADLNARKDGPTDIRVAVNDRTGYSTLQHQVLFPGLSRWFDSANGDVQLNWLSLSVQDDWRLQDKLSYGEPFQIGGDRRLMLDITKHSVPVRAISIVCAAGVIACVLCLWQGATFSWMSLFFGAASLTCCRVLFGQAALVNPPFNGEIIKHALWAILLTPVVIGLGGHLIRTLLPGRIEKRLRALEAWVSYGRLMIASVIGLLIRVVLLALGFKEAVPLGSVRFALSIGFVPFYLLLFALCFFALWREKQSRRTLAWAQVRPFILCSVVLSLCEIITALLVSDLGMILYFIPEAIILAVIGGVAGVEGTLTWLRDESATGRRRQGLVFAMLSGVLPVIPLLLMCFLFTKPQWVLGMVPGLKSKLMTEEQVITDDSDLVTDSTLLRVLQFTNREYLINLGTDSAERIAQDHAIMENYAHRGLLGEGYLKVDVLPAKSVTAMNDNVSAIYIFAQFGVLGALAVLVAYLAISLASAGAQGPVHSFTSWLALIAALSFSFVSIYMIAANFGLLPFTGRNMYLLGLNSLSDIVEGWALLLFIVLGLARAEFHEQAESVHNAASIGLKDIVGSDE